MLSVLQHSFIHPVTGEARLASNFDALHLVVSDLFSSSNMLLIFSTLFARPVCFSLLSFFARISQISPPAPASPPPLFSVCCTLLTSLTTSLPFPSLSVSLLNYLLESLSSLCIQSKGDSRKSLPHPFKPKPQTKFYTKTISSSRTSFVHTTPCLPFSFPLFLLSSVCSLARS